MALTLGACTGTVILPEFEVLPGSVDLPPVSWTDASTDWVYVSVLNTTYFNLTISHVQIDGDAVLLVEAGDLDESAQIPVRSAGLIPIHVRTPTAESRSTWDERAYTGELNFDVSGFTALDPTSGAEDLSSFAIVSASVPIRATTRCDLDGDGDEARACGGGDCNEELAAVSSLATEVCDRADNNCDGAVDEGCDLTP